MAGRLEQPLGGHTGFVLLLAVLYGLLHAASVWTKLAYSYDEFKTLVWSVSVLVLVWATAVLTLALRVAVGQSRRDGARGLEWSTAVALGGLGIMAAACWLVSPPNPTIDATFQTRSAAGGFLKNELL